MLHVAAPAIAKSIDPAAELTASYLRAHGAAEALMRITPEGRVVPELAESMQPISPTEWTVKLREGAKFWSGETVDSAAVVASLERSKRLNALALGQLKDVTAEVAGTYEVRLTTTSPQPELPLALAHYQTVIYNASRLAPDTAGGTDPALCDLTGPYRVSEFSTERSMTLEASESWWGGVPKLERIEVQQVTDNQARAQLALSGQADIVQDVPSERARELQQSETARLVSTSAANTVAVYLNPASTAAPALADVRVRQALGWGADREELVDLATNGLATPTSSWLASNPAYPDADTTGFTALDSDKAAQLLDDAGWVLVDGKRMKDGAPLTLRLLTFGAEAATGEVLQSQWGRLGIDVQVNNVESTLITQAIANGDWDAATQAWTTVGSTSTLIAGQIAPDGAGNHAKLVIPGIADLLTTAATAQDATLRQTALLEVNELMVNEVPAIPLHTRVVATAVGDNVTGFTAHPLQYEQLITGAVGISD
ncbi:ABC transporter substrate-binding protein [Agromyces sp. NPDC058136]|uniref:ABC transporter substrate-binding protein n=1 Tax=Agromyces sp. NPDC058136 TaxID=3346354 RepID=UPI0036DC687F